MANKQTPPAGTEYDETTHQWVPAQPAPQPEPKPAPKE
jgi:hypothetical protein